MASFGQLHGSISVPRTAEIGAKASSGGEPSRFRWLAVSSHSSLLSRPGKRTAPAVIERQPGELRGQLVECERAGNTVTRLQGSGVVRV